MSKGMVVQSGGCTTPAFLNFGGRCYVGMGHTYEACETFDTNRIYHGEFGCNQKTPYKEGEVWLRCARGVQVAHFTLHHRGCILVLPSTWAKRVPRAGGTMGRLSTTQCIHLPTYLPTYLVVQGLKDVHDGLSRQPCRVLILRVQSKGPRGSWTLGSFSAFHCWSLPASQHSVGEYC